MTAFTSNSDFINKGTSGDTYRRTYSGKIIDYVIVSESHDEDENRHLHIESLTTTHTSGPEFLYLSTACSLEARPAPFNNPHMTVNTDQTLRIIHTEPQMMRRKPEDMRRIHDTAHALWQADRQRRLDAMRHALTTA